MTTLQTRVIDAAGEQELLRLAPDVSVAHAAIHMSERRVGAILVCEGDAVCGIFTERDMLERVVAADRAPTLTRLSDVMTPEPAAVTPDDTLLDAIFAMRERRTRHLLIERGSDIVGIVSVRDLLKAVVDSDLQERQRREDLWEGIPV